MENDEQYLTDEEFINLLNTPGIPKAKLFSFGRSKSGYPDFSKPHEGVRVNESVSHKQALEKAMKGEGNFETLIENLNYYIAIYSEADESKTKYLQDLIKVLTIKIKLDHGI